MSVPALLLVAATFGYAGFQATIRVLVYPQLADLPGRDFVRLELTHQHRVTFVVGPLFAFDAASIVLALVAAAGDAGREATAVAAGGCFLAILAVTWLAAVPQHRALSAGPAPDAMRRLLRADTVRLVFALAACGCAVGYALTS